MVTLKKQLGHSAEQQACAYLQTHGLELITQNFHSPFGEIDLIMRDNKEIIFVEVRSRSKKNYADPLDSVTSIKQRKILRTALFFLQERNWLNKFTCRFDVIGINNQNLEWIQDAFTADIL